MPDPGFVGATYVARSSYQDDQECINWYPEVDPMVEDRGVMALYPCPGSLFWKQLALVKEVRQLYVLTGGLYLIAVCGNTIFAISRTKVVTTIGTIPSQSGYIGITDNGAVAYITDGNARYSFPIPNGVPTTPVTTRTDGGFTGGDVCGVVDSFIWYNRPGTNQWGCTDALSAVSGALNFGSKVGAPDLIVTMISDHREVFILGETTSEAWVNVGTFPFPFAVIPGTSTQHGCMARNSVAWLGESFAFLGRDTRGQCTVFKMKGYQPQSISTYAVQQAMDSYSVVSDAIAYTYQQAGHEFYVLTFPTEDVTWVYDDTSRYWHKRAWRDPFNVYHRHRSNCGVSFNGEILVGDWENGKIYSLSQTTFSDSEVAIPMVRRCRHLRADLKRVFYHSLQLQFQPGVGIAGNLVGGRYATFDGIAGNVTTPDSALNSVTGDLTLRGRALVDSTGAFNFMLVSKWLIGTSQCSYQFFVNPSNGQMALLTSPTGTFAARVATQSTANIPAALFQDVVLDYMVTCDVDNGAGGNTVTFSYSIDRGANWTQLGAPVVNTGTTSIFDSTSAVLYGNNDIAEIAKGRIYLGEIYSGLWDQTPTLKNRMYANDTLTGSTSWAASTGEIYSVNGFTVIAGTNPTSGVDPQAMLRWSDDGGSTWSNEHWTSIGQIGAYKNRAIWRMLGESRDRVFEVLVTDPVNRVLVSAEMDAEVGAH